MGNIKPQRLNKTDIYLLTWKEKGLEAEISEIAFYLHNVTEWDPFCLFATLSFGRDADFPGCLMLYYG